MKLLTKRTIESVEMVVGNERIGIVQELWLRKQVSICTTECEHIRVVSQGNINMQASSGNEETRKAEGGEGSEAQSSRQVVSTQIGKLHQKPLEDWALLR